MRAILRVIAGLTVGIVMAGAASAASLDPLGPYFEDGKCNIADVAGSVDCYGMLSSTPTNAAAVDVNNATFNNADSSVDTGLFGITSWYDIYASSTNNATFGLVAGTFNVNWDLTGSVAVLLKFGNTWSAYLFNGLTKGTYDYNLAGMGQNSLSNFRIVSTNPIPVPAALPMLAMGLAGLGLVARRRKRT